MVLPVLWFPWFPGSSLTRFLQFPVVPPGFCSLKFPLVLRFSWFPPVCLGFLVLPGSWFPLVPLWFLGSPVPGSLGSWFSWFPIGSFCFPGSPVPPLVPALVFPGSSGFPCFPLFPWFPWFPWFYLFRYRSRPWFL